MPGPMIIGSMPRNLIIEEMNECITFGTTEEMIASCTSSGEELLSCRNWRIMRPYSSDVWFDRVVMR